MFSRFKVFLRNLFVTIMNLFGYEKYVRVTGNDAKSIWFRTYKLRPKNYVSFLIKKALRRKHNFSKSDLWKHNFPTNNLVYSKGNKYGPTDYVVYLHPRIVESAVKNPTPHPGSKLKSS